MALKLKIKGGGFFKDKTLDRVFGKVVKLVQIYEDWSGGAIIWDNSGDAYDSINAYFNNGGVNGTSFGLPPRKFTVFGESGFPFKIEINGGMMVFGPSEAIVELGSSGTFSVVIYYHGSKIVEKQYNLALFTVDCFLTLTVGSEKIPGTTEPEDPPYGLTILYPLSGDKNPSTDKATVNRD